MSPSEPKYGSVGMSLSDVQYATTSDSNATMHSRKARMLSVGEESDGFRWPTLRRQSGTREVGRTMLRSTTHGASTAMEPPAALITPIRFSAAAKVQASGGISA